jgi:phosphohistidine phosphatase SixA
MPQAISAFLHFASAVAVIGLLVLSASSAGASDQFWAAVKKPGSIILLRHSYAPESPPDTDLTDLKNCSTQRNLDETGRAQARRTGDEFRKHGIKSARIHSSQYCRSLETARLLNIGSVQELATLNQTFFAQPFAMRDAANKTKQFMQAMPPNQLAVLVSHVTNIQAIAGINLGSGEMAAVRLEPSGDVTVLGRLMVK